MISANRQQHALVLFLSVCIAVPVGAAQRQLAAAEGKPNIVLILADNVGYGELGVYGGGILRGAPTPVSTGSPARGCACSTSTLRLNAPLPVRR